ncbi:2-heptaprenyl-1,4-naphthoquinone methyltransferase [Vulgatibacter incomptus]|uniref:2-heptaprenyl-1,4-naphthoquinone methyltransferase n=2 Tax=Vulgatibacter incomptus TaxID=1391653 RepID=A0A0K1PEN9_9BACT|nr:2-heptaprenyl-1,4-naphthoquinone methyltransferase [Vulgatibacter incomptus]
MADPDGLVAGEGPRGRRRPVNDRAGSVRHGEQGASGLKEHRSKDEHRSDSAVHANRPTTSTVDFHDNLRILYLPLDESALGTGLRAIERGTCRWGRCPSKEREETMGAGSDLLTPEEIWRRYDEMEVRLSAPLSERMLELARVGPGQRVLDLATGRGEPAIPAAHRVGPGGSVLGIDVSASMLAMARERAAREGASNLELRVGEASSLEGVQQGSIDSTLVRWGLMYMDSPVDALDCARRAMVPGGLLVAAVWAEPDRTPFYSLPRSIFERYRRLPPIDFEAPGTFRFAQPLRLHRDLERAGLRLEHEEEIEVPVMEAETPWALIAWMRAFGWARFVNDLPEYARKSWEAGVVEAAATYSKAGLIRLGGVTRIIVASRPANE